MSRQRILQHLRDQQAEQFRREANAGALRWIALVLLLLLYSWAVL